MNDSASTIQVFVYGTLKPRESNYLAFCQGNTIAEIEAYTKGELYQLVPGYPAMTPGTQKIQGYLLMFSSQSKILARLDVLENYQADRAIALNDYYRQSVPVYNQQDKLISNAWCYQMTPPKIEKFGGQLINSNIWSDRNSSDEVN